MGENRTQVCVMSGCAKGQPVAATTAGCSLQRRGVLLVVAGPSGVGKGAVIAGVCERRPEVHVSVSYTTRPPRPGEEHGRDYLFITREEFESLRDKGELLEWAIVHGDQCYGTPKGPIDEALQWGQDILLEIDYQGARSVRRLMGDQAALVFVAPPTWQALLDRLRKRHTEDADQIARRLASAREEIAHLGMFDYIIINDALEDAVMKLEAILLSERLRLARADWRGLQQRLLSEADALGQSVADAAGRGDPLA